MFVLIKNKITGDYNTIYKRDIDEFLRLNSFFNADPKLDGKTVDFNFEIIDDKQKIKEILDKDFTSKGRGIEYNEDLPSSTKIAYSLYPININNDKFLLRWKNNTPLLEQEGDKQDTLSRGTFIHKILELWVNDKDERKKDKILIENLKLIQKLKKPSKKIIEQIDTKILNNIRKYIQKAFDDDEILNKIKNLDELKEELAYLSINCLPQFIKEELIFTDLVYSEIFLQDKDIQGSIDTVLYKDNKFTIFDYKTTSSVDKKTGKPKFKTNSTESLAPYARQLYVYNKLLKNTGMTHLYDNTSPDYYIIQIHLINGKYKKFSIPQGLVESQGKTLEKVLSWYWKIRKGDFSEEEELNELDELGYITL